MNKNTLHTVIDPGHTVIISPVFALYVPKCIFSVVLDWDTISNDSFINWKAKR